MFRDRGRPCGCRTWRGGWAGLLGDKTRDHGKGLPDLGRSLSRGLGELKGHVEADILPKRVPHGTILFAGKRDGVLHCAGRDIAFHLEMEAKAREALRFGVGPGPREGRLEAAQRM